MFYNFVIYYLSLLTGSFPLNAISFGAVQIQLNRVIKQSVTIYIITI